MHPFCYRVFWNERKAVIYRRPLQCSVVHISSQFSPLTACFVAIERKNKQTVLWFCTAKIKAYDPSVGPIRMTFCVLYTLCKYYVAQFGGWGLFVCWGFYVPPELFTHLETWWVRCILPENYNCLSYGYIYKSS